MFTTRCRRERGEERKRTLWRGRKALTGGGVNPPPLPRLVAWVIYTQGRGVGWIRANSKLDTANRGKSPSGGGGSAVSGLFPPRGESSERRHSFKGQTESSLPVLVFCAIKKPEKINIT